MLVRIELHCHSTHSDGSLPAHEVAARAHATGVALFCLTDHDTCAGFAATQAVFPNALQGVELSCSEDNRSVHLLVYKSASSIQWQVMLEALEHQQRVRRERVHLIAANLAEIGAAFDPDALVARVAGSVGRPHVAQELVRLGIVSSIDEAFTRYLQDGGPGDVQVNRPSLAEGLALGLKAGGVMSLAHPHMYGNRAQELIEKHKDLGLSGLEVYYGAYKPKVRHKWAALAEATGLVATGGSDFHGEQKPKILRPGVEMPEDHTKRLLDWLSVDANQLTS